MDRALGLPLQGGVDDAPGDAIDEEDANEGALMVDVCALRHHGQQVGVQALGSRTEEFLQSHDSPSRAPGGRQAGLEPAGSAEESGFLARRACYWSSSPLPLVRIPGCHVPQPVLCSHHLTGSHKQPRNGATVIHTR